MMIYNAKVEDKLNNIIRSNFNIKVVKIAKLLRQKYPYFIEYC